MPDKIDCRCPIGHWERIGVRVSNWQPSNKGKVMYLFMMFLFQGGWRFLAVLGTLAVVLYLV